MQTGGNKSEEAPPSYSQSQPFHGRGEPVRSMASLVPQPGANVQILAMHLQARYLSPGPQVPLILCVGPRVMLKPAATKLPAPGQLRVH